MSAILPSIISMSFDYFEEQMMPVIMVSMGCMCISFLGYMIYLVGIGFFRGAQRTINSELRTRNVMVTELIMPILLILYYVIYYSYYEEILRSAVSAIIYGLLPWLGSLGAVIFMHFQFKSLSNEGSWSDKAKKGADDIRFSYDCVLWIQVVLILGIGILVLTFYNYWTKLQSLRQASYSSFGVNDMFDGINSLTSIVNNCVNTIKFEVMTILLIVFIFSMLCAIYRIKGWLQIHQGDNQEDDVNALNSDKFAKNKDRSRFCHKCGVELQEESLFCPSCGTPVIMSLPKDRSGLNTAEPQIDDKSILSVPQDEDTEYEDTLTKESFWEDEEEERVKRKKWYLWFGVAAVVISIGVVIWMLMLHSQEKKCYVVYADSTGLYRSVENESGRDLIADLPYGTPVEYSSSNQDDHKGSWVNVTVKEGGKTKHGFIDESTFISKDDFEKINNAGLKDYDIRKSVSSVILRKAVLQALIDKGEGWHLEKIENGNGFTEFNGRTLLVRGISPSERCFGFVLSHDSANWERDLYVYTITESYDPEFIYSERLKENDGKLIDVSYKKGKFLTKYTKINLNEKLAKSVDELYETPMENDQNNGGTIEEYKRMKGYIDGKYEIEMGFYEQSNNTLYGDYCYVKNNVPIRIRGPFKVGADGVKMVSLDEYVNGAVTGHFEGKYDGDVFFGTWRSADGERELPFKVTKY